MSQKRKRTPSHYAIQCVPPLYIPERIGECFPSGKAKVRGYCKYCYKTHRDWWQMKFEDYEEDVLLCGKCEHTSLAEFVRGGAEE